MIAATWPSARAEDARLLVVDPTSGRIGHATVASLARYLHEGDLVVVNDAATIPASIAGETLDGEPIELRLASRNDDGTWRVVLLGRGDWRTKTEDRAPPPVLAVGARVHIGRADDGAIEARVTAVSARSARLVDVRFGETDEDAWRAIYRAGRPVQYGSSWCPT